MSDENKAEWRKTSSDADADAPRPLPKKAEKKDKEPSWFSTANAARKKNDSKTGGLFTWVVVLGCSTFIATCFAIGYGVSYTKEKKKKDSDSGLKLTLHGGKVRHNASSGDKRCSRPSQEAHVESEGDRLCAWELETQQFAGGRGYGATRRPRHLGGVIGPDGKSFYEGDPITVKGDCQLPSNLGCTSGTLVGNVWVCKNQGQGKGGAGAAHGEHPQHHPALPHHAAAGRGHAAHHPATSGGGHHASLHPSGHGAAPSHPSGHAPAPFHPAKHAVHPHEGRPHAAAHHGEQAPAAAHHAGHSPAASHPGQHAPLHPAGPVAPIHPVAPAPFTPSTMAETLAGVQGNPQGTVSQLKSALASAEPVLIFVISKHCGACQALGKALQKLSEHQPGLMIRLQKHALFVSEHTVQSAGKADLLMRGVPVMISAVAGGVQLMHAGFSEAGLHSVLDMLQDLQRRREENEAHEHNPHRFDPSWPGHNIPPGGKPPAAPVAPAHGAAGHHPVAPAHGAAGHHPFAPAHGAAGHHPFAPAHAASGHHPFAPAHAASGHHPFAPAHAASGHDPVAPGSHAAAGKHPVAPAHASGPSAGHAGFKASGSSPKVHIPAMQLLTLQRLKELAKSSKQKIVLGVDMVHGLPDEDLLQKIMADVLQEVQPEEVSRHVHLVDIVHVSALYNKSVKGPAIMLVSGKDGLLVSDGDFASPEDTADILSNLLKGNVQVDP